jgi:hypothetical protein
MYSFCTYFDHWYLLRGLILYDSLRDHCASFQLFVLCLSDTCYQFLKKVNLPGIYPIPLQKLEEMDPELLTAKKNRLRIEYYFTLSPCLPLYLINQFPDIELLTYLDTDLCFFANPLPIFTEIGGHSVAIVDHKFPLRLNYREAFGIYNVSWVTFRADEHGLTCLTWWRERCLEWCYNRLEGGKFADQKYLDDWPSRFKNVLVIKQRGVNLAPWNIEKYYITSSGSRVLIDNDDLIFFHFHGFKHLVGRLYDSGFSGYQTKMSKAITKTIFYPYIKRWIKAKNCLNRNIFLVISDHIKEAARFHQLRAALPFLYKILRFPYKLLKIAYTGTYIYYTEE